MLRFLVMGSVLLGAGCGQQDPESKAAATGAASAAGAALFLRTGVPPAASPLQEVRETAAAGASVSVMGRIRDFIDGRAAFLLIDTSLLACSDRPDDRCPTPWDYCCYTPEEIARASMTVELRQGGKVLNESLQGLQGLDRLDRVVVTGQIERDAQGNVILDAVAVYCEG